MICHIRCRPLGETGNGTPAFVDCGAIRSYNTFVKLTLQLQLQPSPDQKQMLLATMTAYNEAATYAARVGFNGKRFSQPTIHRLCYRELRERFCLSAQMAVRAIGKAVECFRRDKTRCPVFKPLGAMTYDERIMSFKGPVAVSLLTLEGRQIIPMVYGEYQRERFDRIKGQCDLIYRGGKFYLLASMDFPEKPPVEIKEFIGVDLGVVNLATTSDSERISGSGVEAVRVKYHRIRRTLGRKTHRSNKRRTRKNARRAMKRIGNRESRFRRDVNHVISRKIVDLAKDTGRGIALENLTHIRSRARFRKKQRSRMGGWAFAQLRSFLTYKGQMYGIPVVAVDPRNTSRTCEACGHCEKANRKSQSEFQCRSCGHSVNADIQAARNIAAKASINMLKVSEPHRILVA
jgi:putative transposase